MCRSTIKISPVSIPQQKLTCDVKPVASAWVEWLGSAPCLAADGRTVYLWLHPQPQEGSGVLQQQGLSAATAATAATAARHVP